MRKIKYEFHDSNTGIFIEFNTKQPLIVVETKKCFFWDSGGLNQMISFLKETQKKIKKLEKRRS